METPNDDYRETVVTDEIKRKYPNIPERYVTDCPVCDASFTIIEDVVGHCMERHGRKVFVIEHLDWVSYDDGKRLPTLIIHLPALFRVKGKTGFFQIPEKITFKKDKISKEFHSSLPNVDFQ